MIGRPRESRVLFRAGFCMTGDLFSQPALGAILSLKFCTKSGEWFGNEHPRIRSYDLRKTIRYYHRHRPE